MDLMVKATAGYARMGDRYVFLDLDADRYVATGREASQAIVRTAVGQALTRADLACLGPLLRSGLLVEAPSNHPWPVLTGPPDKEWIALCSGRARGLVDIPCVLWSIARARRGLRKRPIRDVLARFAKARADRRSARDDAEEVVDRLVSAFRSSRALVPTLDQCLPRALALATLLSRRGIEVQLTFGIALPPFAAHCWVERDGVVLGDSVDVVRNFVPILRV